MTEREALDLARALADQYQEWYEVHTDGQEFIILPHGENMDGYTHYMSISPRVKVHSG